MHISIMLVFWSLVSLVRNSVVLAVYLLFSVVCFFTVHEHLYKVHNLFQQNRRQSFFKVNCRLIFFLFFHCNCVISRLFQKWCSSGVVNALPPCKTIDFIGFSGILQDTAVTHKKYRNHVYFPS